MNGGALLSKVVPPALSVALGVSIAFTVPERGSDAWLTWASLAVALTGAAGLVFSYGLDQWRSLPEPGRTRTVLLTTVAVSVSVVALAVGYTAVSPSAGGRGPALVATTICGTLPAAAVLVGTRPAVRALADVPSPGQRVAELIELRRLTFRLLLVLGSLVALATFALGAAAQVTRDRSHPIPPQGIILFGGAGTALVGLLYAPAIAAVRQQARKVRDDLFDLRHAPHDAETVLDLAEQRHRMETLLGLTREASQDFQTGVVILGPLLSSAAALLLPS